MANDQLVQAFFVENDFYTDSPGLTRLILSELENQNATRESYTDFEERCDNDQYK
jgi:hypothetical protein